MSHENSSQIVDIARKAIPFMSEHSIPITPENYCVWYGYFDGRMENLQIALGEMVKANTIFDDRLNHKLYTQFFTRTQTDEQEKKLKDEIKAIEEAHATADKILKPIARDLDGASKSTDNYGVKLKEMAGHIKDDQDISNMHSIMMALAKETEKISDEHRAISSGLKDSTQQFEDLRQKLAQAKAEARMDDLTKLKNRRAFNERIVEVIEIANQGENVFSALAIVDIDKFKRINDTYGHPIGDKALISIASQLMEHTGSDDEVFRVGGEEFAVIFSASSLSDALERMESARALIASHQFAIRGAVETITISAGLAQIEKGASQQEVERLADMAVYLAKESGRNNVKTEKDLKAQDAT